MEKLVKVLNSNQLIALIENNIEHFDKTKRSENLSTKLHEFQESVLKCSTLINQINAFASDYDFDEETPGNGYRSFVDIFDSAVNETIKICSVLIRNREKLLFRPDNYAKDIDEWTKIFTTLSQLCEYLTELHQNDNETCLMTGSVGYENILTRSFGTVKAKPFFAKNLGFQFCPSLKKVVKVICAGMTSYHNFYYKDQMLISKTFSFASSFVRQMLNPNKRAAKFVNACENSTTEFCRAYWFLAEHDLFHTFPSLMATTVDVNKVFKIPPLPLQTFSEKFNKMIDVPIPSSHIGLEGVQCRLVCAKKRKGMNGFDSRAASKAAEPSKHIIFHAHGGGWATQTSKSHDVYLREWAAKIDVPILSIDYSLAPEAPFPRSVEEMLYAYCWILKNPEIVGWTGEHVVVAGDSAGGNLVTSLVVNCIEKGIRKPNGLVCIYTPFWIGYPMSPARFLSFICPVLPFGFTSRLVKSYAEKIEDQSIIENRKANIKNKQRTIYLSHDAEFNVPVIESTLLSPYLVSDEILKKFPPSKFISSNMDPCLDDGVEFAKKLKKQNVDVQVEVLSGITHGFLYFTQFSNECHDGSMVCVENIKALLN